MNHPWKKLFTQRIIERGRRYFRSRRVHDFLIDDDGPSLVVCPAAVAYNWQAEMKKFTPQLTVQVIDGSAQQRRQLISDIGQTDIVITSYDSLKRDLGTYRHRQFNNEILDEAQFIKNPRT